MRSYRAVLLLCLLAAGAQAVEAQVRFETSQVLIVGDSGLATLRVELALTDVQHQLGLQDRDSLRAGWGMFFRLASEMPAQLPAVTMYRTRMPLDVAFLDRDGTIVDIVSMVPCTSEVRSDCKRYASARPFWAMLEVSAGFFARRGIRTGHRLLREH
jgi:uncharacterized membrane protein (UPF0127 family)